MNSNPINELNDGQRSQIYLNKVKQKLLRNLIDPNKENNNLNTINNIIDHERVSKCLKVTKINLIYFNF